MEPIAKGEGIYEFIPQRPPFVMVDSLFEKGEAHVVSGLSIIEDNVMVENGVLKDGGLIENMAQTAALFAGAKYKDAGQPAPVGYIAGIKQVTIHKNPEVGSKIRTKTTLVNEMMNIQIVNAEIKDSNDEVVASCELRIFIND